MIENKTTTVEPLSMRYLFRRGSLIVVHALMFFAIFLAASCGSDGVEDDIPGDDDNHKPPVEDITPGAGIDLYGLVVDDLGKPVPDVVVSDGFTCTVTDGKGVYQMKRDAAARFVFYSTPAEFEIATSSSTVKTASFYAPLTSIKRYDFKLKRLPAVETQFNLICIGDPQVTNMQEFNRFRDETISDIKKQLQTTNRPTYALALGDIVGDKPMLFDQMKVVLGSAGIPLFTTIGNHDKVAPSGSSEPRKADDFTRVFGPLNYSFNRGNVHFVCLDNVVYSNASSYGGGFTDSQIEWLKADLRHVPKSKMVIVYYHIPIRNSSGITNRTKMLEALSGFAEVHLMAGHTHYTENFSITSPVKAYEHIHAAPCGSWWRSTLNGDGTPNGYAVYEINGAKFSNWYYKPVKLPQDFQIRLHRGDLTYGGQYGQFSFGQGPNSIIANVWNADSEWKIEAYEDGVNSGSLTKLPTSLKDAWTLGYHIGVLNRNPSNYSPASKHLYLYTLKNPEATLEIRATDRFGTVYKQSEIVSEYETAASYQ